MQPERVMAQTREGGQRTGRGSTVFWKVNLMGADDGVDEQ